MPPSRARSGGGSLHPLSSPSHGRSGGIGGSHEWIRRQWRMLSVDPAAAAPSTACLLPSVAVVISGGSSGGGGSGGWIRRRWRRPRADPIAFFLPCHIFFTASHVIGFKFFHPSLFLFWNRKYSIFSHYFSRTDNGNTFFILSSRDTNVFFHFLTGNRLFLGFFLDFYFFTDFSLCFAFSRYRIFFSPVLKGNRLRIGGQRKRAAVFQVFWPLSQVIGLFFRIIFSFLFFLTSFPLF